MINKKVRKEEVRKIKKTVKLFKEELLNHVKKGDRIDLLVIMGLDTYINSETNIVERKHNGTKTISFSINGGAKYRDSTKYMVGQIH